MIGSFLSFMFTMFVNKHRTIGTGYTHKVRTDLFWPSSLVFNILKEQGSRKYKINEYSYEKHPY